MPDLSNTQIPPPTDWQAFERLCHSLWKEIWRDPNTQLNGRNGQEQAGIDVFGYSRGETKPSGIQCKGKDGRFGAGVEEDELLAEIERAKCFSPPLREFILATTAQSDAKIQRLARAISEKHRGEGIFTVDVLSWSEIQQRMVEHPIVLEVHYPHLAPKSDALLEGIQQVQLNQEQAAEISSSRHERLMSAILESLSPNKDLGDELDAELDQYRDLILAGRPKTALEMLERLDQRAKSEFSQNIHFRIKTNRAAAKLALGDEEGAATDFLAAYDLQPALEKALVNRVVAHLLRRDKINATRAAREAVAAFPEGASAWSMLINAENSGATIVTIPAEMPESVFRSEDVLLAIANAYMQVGDTQAAEKYFSDALADFPASIQARIGLGAALARQVSSDGKLYSGLPLDEERLETLNRAAATMEEAWKSFKTRENLGTCFEFALNYSSVLMSLGAYPQAEAVVDSVLAQSSQVPDILRQKLRLLLENERNDEAAALLDGEGARNFPDYWMLRAEVLRRLGKHAQALDALRAAELLAVRSEALGHIGPAFVEIAVEALGFEEGLKASERYVQLGHANPWFLLALAGVLRRSGRTVEAIENVRGAVRLCTESDNHQLLLLSADQLFDLGQEDESAAIYRIHCPRSSDSPSLRRFVTALLRGDRRKEFADLLASIKPDILSVPFYKRASAELAFQSGNLVRAKAEFLELAEREGASLAEVTRVALIEIQEGNEKAALTRLKHVDQAKLKCDELLSLGKLMRKAGGVAEGLDVLYAAQRMYPNEPKAQLVFVANVLLPANNVIPHAETLPVQAGFAFSIQDKAGKERAYVIESNDQFQLLAGELRPDHPLAQKAMGRAAGDSIILAENQFGQETGTIRWVKHKYLHAAHEIMETFESRFPGVRGFHRATVEPSQGAAGIAPILASIDLRSESTAEIERLYRELRIPLGMVARLAGSNVLDVWRSWIVSADKTIAVCQGTAQEREQAISRLREAKEGLLLEPLSLYLLYSLELLEIVETTFGRLGVAQATLDEIRALIDERSLHSDGYLSLGKQGNDYVKQEISAADVKADSTRLGEILAWAEEHCVIVPSIPKEDVLEENKAKILDLAGDVYKETLLACSGSGRLLICDDWHLRAIAEEAVNVPGVWTQILLIEMRERKALTVTSYAKAVSVLASSNYSFTSLDGGVIFKCAEREAFQLTATLSRVLNALDGAIADVPALASVMARFLDLLWSRELDPSNQRKLTYAILAAAGVTGAPQRSVLLQALGTHLTLGRLPRRAAAEVVAWYQGHFLLPNI